MRIKDNRPRSLEVFISRSLIAYVDLFSARHVCLFILEISTSVRLVSPMHFFKLLVFIFKIIILLHFLIFYSIRNRFWYEVTCDDTHTHKPKT